MGVTSTMDRFLDSIPAGLVNDAAGRRRAGAEATGNALGSLLAQLAEGPYQIRNLHVGGRRTTIRLELPFWQALDELCEREDLNLDELATRLDGLRGDQGLTGMLRCFILTYWRQRSA